MGDKTPQAPEQKDQEAEPSALENPIIPSNVPAITYPEKTNNTPPTDPKFNNKLYATVKRQRKKQKVTFV